MSPTTNASWGELTNEQTGRLTTIAPLGRGAPPPDAIELDGDAIRFAFVPSASAAAFLDRVLRPRPPITWRRGVLDQFMALQTDAQFVSFARRFGPLMLFPVKTGPSLAGFRPDPGQQLASEHRELLIGWRAVRDYFATALTFAAWLHDVAPGEQGNILDLMGPAGYIDLSGDLTRLPIRTQRAAANGYYNALVSQCVGWCGIRPAVTLFPRPSFAFEDNSSDRRLQASRLSLFGALTVQLLAASTTRGLAVCSNCGQMFIPAVRQPATNRRRYCEPCRKDGAPHREAQRQYRNKRRG